MKKIIISGNKINYQLNPQTGYFRAITFYFKNKEIHKEYLQGSDQKKFKNEEEIENYLLTKAQRKLCNYFKKYKTMTKIDEILQLKN